MVVYKILIKRDAEKDLALLPKVDLRRVTKKIQDLSSQPRPHGCEKLQGERGYRIRQGDHRVVYLVDDSEKTVRIIKIGNRKEIYR